MTERRLSGLKLSKQLDVALVMAKDSPSWNADMENGCRATVEFIRGAMKRGLLDDGPYDQEAFDAMLDAAAVEPRH